MTKQSLHKRLPLFLRKTAGNPVRIHSVKKILREEKVHTVCEEARCPNLSECFSEDTATFLLLGDVCTRKCSFCAVRKGTPGLPDREEPGRVAGAVGRLGLSHVVLTSVTRDDLPDGGAGQFAFTVKEIHSKHPNVTIEALTPDFKGDESCVRRIISEGVAIFGHNLETVPGLYRRVRPMADYKTSLHIISSAKNASSKVLTKSGIMVGLGETKKEVIGVMRDLRQAGCDIVTIGQYLRPDKESMAVQRYVEPGEFDEYRLEGKTMGFMKVLSGPFVRSSYHAKMTLINKIS